MTLHQVSGVSCEAPPSPTPRATSAGEGSHILPGFPGDLHLPGQFPPCRAGLLIGGRRGAVLVRDGDRGDSTFPSDSRITYSYSASTSIAASSYGSSRGSQQRQGAEGGRNEEQRVEQHYSSPGAAGSCGSLSSRSEDEMDVPEVEERRFSQQSGVAKGSDASPQQFQLQEDAAGARRPVPGQAAVPALSQHPSPASSTTIKSAPQQKTVSLLGSNWKRPA
eukprot:gene13152-biopygen7797